LGNTTDSNTRDEAIRRAKVLFAHRKAAGADFSNGPCLSEEIMPDWCVDVAHNPRQAVDDFPDNQCRSYREGRVHHFVELDTDGNLIRAV
jgi:hypothetical protein